MHNNPSKRAYTVSSPTVPPAMLSDGTCTRMSRSISLICVPLIGLHRPPIYTLLWHNPCMSHAHITPLAHVAHIMHMHKPCHVYPIMYTHHSSIVVSYPSSIRSSISCDAITTKCIYRLVYNSRGYTIRGL